MNAWVLVDTFELPFMYRGADILSAYMSENDAIEALCAIAKQHDCEVNWSSHPDVIFCDNDGQDDRMMSHHVDLRQIQLL